jgi:hypothetical protein
MIMNSTILHWRKNQLSTWIAQVEGIIRCIKSLHSITLVLDQSANDYYNRVDTGASKHFNNWIGSHEYSKWKELRNYTFPLGSIRQYY